MKPVFLFVLIFLPSLAFGQSDDAVNAADPLRGSYQGVIAKQVEVGFAAKLMQAASIAFNPSQRNTHWPLFAYPVDEVPSSRSCNRPPNAPLEGEVALVRPGSSEEFLGIRIHDASLFGEICSSGRDPEILEMLLYSTHGMEKFSETDELYLLSERPLRDIRSSFRTNLELEH